MYVFSFLNSISQKIGLNPKLTIGDTVAIQFIFDKIISDPFFKFKLAIAIVRAPVQLDVAIE